MLILHIKESKNFVDEEDKEKYRLQLILKRSKKFKG